MRRAFILALAFLAPVMGAARAQDIGSLVHETVSAACGQCIVGVSIGSAADETTWKLQFAAGATSTQESEAQAALAALTAAQWQALALAEIEIEITSSSTPALNGTYSISGDAKANLDGIYAGIVGGNGLPGGGSTMNYSDVNGAMHGPFSSAQIEALCVAARNQLYVLSQGQTPTQPATIP